LTVEARCLKLSGATLLLVLASCGGPDRPNIALVIIDTLRADHVGAYGARQPRTPHLDRLAREGVVFERCFSQYPLTLPSIATLMTSQWPFVHGVRTNRDQQLGESAYTLAEALRAGGYRTAAFVSAFPVRGETGCAQGFDLYDDDFSEPYEIYGGQYDAWSDRLTGSERRGGITVARALEWLKTAKQPYFLCVHLFDPHAPYDPPEPFASAYDLPYAGEVAYADDLAGRLVDALAGGGNEAGTLISVVSDHGEGLREHGEYAHGFFLYDTTLRVPWILWWPGHLTPQKVPADVALIDLAPTLMDAIGLPVPEAWAGRSCSPLLQGTPDGARPIYAETYYTRFEYGWSEMQGWITPAAKWIRAPKPELYDRRSDPEELRNASSSRVDLATRLDDELSRFIDEETEKARRRGIATLVEPLRLDEADQERLRNLGYVGGPAGVQPEGSLPDPKDAVPEWNRIQDSKAAVRRGSFHLREGRPADAVQEFRQALARRPTPEALQSLGAALAGLGRYEDARDTLELALRDAPGDVTALTWYAITLQAMNDLRAAESALRRATDVDTLYAPAWRARLVLHRQMGDLPQAASAGERYLRLAPGDWEAMVELAAVDGLLGRHAAAATLHRRVAAMRPWDPVAEWRLGEAEARAGNLIAAREALEAARSKAGRGAVRDSIEAALRRLGGK
jgi:arylsulfatase A-like enzyme/Flp pilus assembly protein TadD